MHHQLQQQRSLRTTPLKFSITPMEQPRELHQLQQLQFKVQALISMVQQGLVALDLPLKAGAMVPISVLQDMQQQWARQTQQL
jgi:hypothetical protein